MMQSPKTSACDLQALALREGWDFDLAEQTHLRRTAASTLTFDIAAELFSTLAGPHDFWWPLVVGAQPLHNVLVMEDTWGSLATRLAPIAERVCALFAHKSDTALLAKSRIAKNVEVHIVEALTDSSLWQEQWDLIVLQRPAATELEQLRKRAQQSLAATGSIVLVDELSASKSTVLFKDKGSRLRWTEFKRLPHPSQIFVSHAPIRALLTNLPDLSLRNSSSSMAAILEGKGKHGLRRRALLNFVRPVSALAISGGRRTYVQQILEHPRVRAHARGRDLIVKRILAGNEDTTVMLAGGASSPACEVVLRAAHRPRAAQRVRHNAAVLQSLAELQLPFEVPALLASGEYAEGAFISAESCLPGTVLLSVQAGSAKNSYMRTAVEKWTLFRRDHASEVAIADGDYERLIGSAFAKMRRFTSDADATRIDQLSGALKHALCSRKWSLGPMHGDFKVGNILVDGRGDVCGVIDWDCWEPRGLPLIDAMTLCVYEDARDSKRHFGDSITRGLFRGEWSGFHQDVIATSALQYELSPRDLDTLKVAFWVINLRDRIHWLALSTEREAELYLSAPLRDALELIG